MNPGTRACVAYVAGRAVSGSSGLHVYDYSQSKYISVGGTVNGREVSVYDYVRKCHFSGTLPQLFDYGSRGHVSIEIIGNQFSGFDYAAKHHFSGTVNGTSVTLFDYGDAKHFSYGL